MSISQERFSHLASVLVDGIWNDDLVDYADEEMAMKLAKKVALRLFNEQGEIDEKVRAKIVSLKRNVMEGSPEWDILYGKYYEEEANKRG